MSRPDIHLVVGSLPAMLGVCREIINGVASALQRRNLITRSPGKMRILDGAGLKAASCVCYEMIKDNGCGQV